MLQNSKKKKERNKFVRVNYVCCGVQWGCVCVMLKPSFCLGSCSVFCRELALTWEPWVLGLSLFSSSLKVRLESGLGSVPLVLVSLHPACF